MRVEVIKTMLLGEVLILVVMEYTQWVGGNFHSEYERRLNPCCNGIYSMRQLQLLRFSMQKGLNPCCNGIYSMSK